MDRSYRPAKASTEPSLFVRFIRRVARVAECFPGWDLGTFSHRGIRSNPPSLISAMRIFARSTASIMLALAVIAADAGVEAALEPATGPSVGGTSIAGAPTDEQVLPVRPSPAPPPPPPRGNPLWAVPLADLSAMREHPIFSPSRRPPARPAVAAVIEPAPPVPPMAQRPPLTLVGTIVGETTQIGVFIEENTHQMVRLPIGG